MSRTSLLVLLLVVGAAPTSAEEASQAIVVPPGQVIIQVKGVVCSFCAYGTEKNLSKLPFLDKAQFGDGVLMDIHANRITLALGPNEPVDLPGIHEAIRKGGYDPITVHLRLSGTVTHDGARYVLTTTETGQIFVLSGLGRELVSEQQVVDVQAHLDASRIPALPAGEPIEVVVDRLEGAS